MIVEFIENSFAFIVEFETKSTKFVINEITTLLLFVEV